MTDLNARSFTRRGPTLVPVDQHALEWLLERPEGRELLITSRRVRSPKHHRWFFAMLHKVVTATGKWKNERRLADDLKDMLGLYDIEENIFGGPPRKVLHSISWAAMDEDEFKNFVQASLDLIAQHTGIDPEMLMAEVNAEEGPLQ